MPFRLEREERAPGIRWVHLYATEGESLEGADRRVNTEARKWARELNMTAGNRVSSGGQYGIQEWRHSVCYSFKP